VLSKLYRGLGTNARALLGCFNPLFSAALNESAEGVLITPSEYTDLHSAKDIYGDLMLAWQRL
jgi:hypothetical protein